jgi:hypothetical protein
MVVGRCVVPRPELWLTGVEPNGPVPGRPFGPLYTEVWFGTPPAVFLTFYADLTNFTLI